MSHSSLLTEHSRVAHKMLRFLVFIFALVVVCQADVAVSPPIKCGAMPRAIYMCLGAPKIVKSGASMSCDKSLSECERLTCIFRNSGWMDGDNLDKKKLSEHFDQVVKDNPEWSAAVENVKATCLTTDLPPQGIHLNCPAYDAMQCSFASFIKNAPPSQWKSSQTCDYPRQYAAACPVCPSDCFAPLVPIGACNACLSLPRSP